MVYVSAVRCLCRIYLSLRDNLRKKVSKTCARNCGRKQRKMRRKSAERCGTCQEFAGLFPENCGFRPNHEICCKFVAVESLFGQ